MVASQGEGTKFLLDYSKFGKGKSNQTGYHGVKWPRLICDSLILTQHPLSEDLALSS